MFTGGTEMEQKDTDKEECWQRFIRTGSVADYLNYSASSFEEQVPERENDFRRNNDRTN